MDSSSAVIVRYDYDPYGRRTKVSGSYDADFGYTGHFTLKPSWIGEERVMTIYRIYLPGQGIWASRDPLGEREGVNLYGYVGGDPIRWFDPLGLWSPGAHDALFDFAFHGKLSQRDINTLKRESRRLDLKENGSSDAHKHSMAEDGQSAEDAKAQRDAYIEYELEKARDAEKAGCHEDSLRHFARAQHARQDELSPEHTMNGSPNDWDPTNPIDLLGHSPFDYWGDETALDIPSQAYESYGGSADADYSSVYGQ